MKSNTIFSGEAVTSEAITESVHKIYDSVSMVVVRREGRDDNNEDQIKSMVKKPGFYYKAGGKISEEVQRGSLKKGLTGHLSDVTDLLLPKDKNQPEVGC